MMIEVFDPSDLDYEDWLCYFFDRLVIPFSGDSESLHDETALVEIGDKARLLGYLRRFNIEFTVVKKRFSMDQIDQGLWVLYGGGIHAGSLLASEEIPLDLRLNAIESFELLYRQAVKGWTGDIKNAEVGSVFWMLWDLVLEWAFIQSEHHEADLNPVLDKCAEILERILDMDDKACEACALHGLQHLRTPRARAVIGRYLEQHPEAPDPERYGPQ